ncbi:serine/threonine-protein kinase [Spirillospora sp. NPDC047279]|uniref:serine/threonine-protein kinase n=1 Tax=Spirillospora sp. NPDC047279 TaxID=3155478 RepID=UPI0033D673FE
MIGDWRVEGFTEVRELGRGGQGRVVLARHATAGDPVAIKYLNRRDGDARDIERLRGEAVMLGRVTDPHVVRLYRFVLNDTGAALVMEAVNGVSLREILAEHGTLEPEAALSVLKGSLLGLAAAHGVGVVHRDYKPANVVVRPDGLSKLIDFGIAASAGEDGAGGTPAYMAPEQWRGSPATPATDVYAATCVFFECVQGRRPYAGEGLAAQHREAPIPVEDLPEDLPEGLRELVAAGLAKTPEERPPGAAAFLSALETAANAAYGPDWEARGVRALAVATAALAALLPLGAAVLGSGAAASGAAAGGAAGGAAAGGAAGGGAAAGAGAGGAGILASTGAKIAAVAVGTAVAAGGTGAYVSRQDDGGPVRARPSATASLAVRPVSETRTLTSPKITYTLRFPQVGGLPNAAVQAAVNRTLRKPLDGWVDSAQTDIMAFNGGPGSFRPTAVYETGLAGPRLFSVRYTFADTQRNTGLPVRVTVDLTTGRELAPHDMLRDEARTTRGTTRLIHLLERRGLMDGPSCRAPYWDADRRAYISKPLPEKSWNIAPGPDAVGLKFFGVFLKERHAEISAPMASLGYSMACFRSAPYAKVPYGELRDVFRPEVLRMVGA